MQTVSLFSMTNVPESHVLEQLDWSVLTLNEPYGQICNVSHNYILIWNGIFTATGMKQNSGK